MELYKKWTLSAIRDWATEMFPDAFAALPAVEDIAFVKLDEEMLKLAPFRLPTNATKKVMCIGLWDGLPCDPRERVFAYLHGSHNSQVGYIREDNHATPIRYRKLFPDDMKKVDVEEPLCFVADTAGRRTMTRLGAMVFYYFVAAKQVSYFTADASFKKEFPKACSYIERQWVPVRMEGLEPELPSSVYQLSDVASEHDLPDAGSAFVKVEDMPHFRSDDTMAAASCKLLPRP